MKTALHFVIFLFVGNMLQAQYKESDWNYRDQWMDVDRMFKMAGVTLGDTVADIGCHEGYLSIRLARTVGETGQVFAVDVRQDRLVNLEENARDRNISNIETILGDYDNPHLPESKVDVVFIVDTYHEIKSYRQVLEHVKNSLKPDGRVLILEKLKDHARNKSRSEQVKLHTLSSHYVQQELQEAGFNVITTIDNMGKWEEEQDKTMWLVVAMKTQAK